MENVVSLLHGGLYNFVWFVVILSVIVFVHEFGHYIVAKLSKVKIEAFSIGFGPEVFGWNDKSGTRWKVCYLPFGGYVKMFGDVNPASVPDSEKIAEMTDSEKKLAFHYKSLPIKSAVVFAGPLANFILAVVLLIFMFTFYGRQIATSEISGVLPASAAEIAGLKEGDLITKIDNNKIELFSDIQRIIALNTGTQIVIEYTRNGQSFSTVATPKVDMRKDIFGNEIKLALLGIQANVMKTEKLEATSAVSAAFKETYNLSASTLIAVGQMVTGQRSASELTGPIGIAKFSGQSAKHGMQAVLWFMVIISINLGLVNLFPIPLLDGGHLLYYLAEAVRGKPLADKVQQYGFRFGMGLILLLSIFAIFNDLRNLSFFR